MAEVRNRKRVFTRTRMWKNCEKARCSEAVLCEEAQTAVLQDEGNNLEKELRDVQST